MGQKQIFSILVASILLSSTSIMALSSVPNAYAGGGGGFDLFGLPVCSTNPLPLDFNDAFLAMTFRASDGVFLVTDGNDLYELTAGGVLTNLGDIDDEVKGLAFVSGTLYGIDRDSALLHEIDPANGDTLDTIAIDFADYNRGHGLATDPTTGILYAIINDFDNKRHLVTIDPITGDTVLKGILPASFGSLAFSSDGTLHGTTGFASGITKSFFQIDKTNASGTFVCYYGGAGNSGFNSHSLAYNSDDDQFYQFLAQSLLPFDGQTVLSPCDTTNVVANGPIGTTRALTYWIAEDKFLWGDAFSLYSATPGGSTSFIGSTGFFMHGLTFNLAQDTLYAAERFSSTIREIDPTDASTDSSIGITLPGSFFGGIHGLATDPTTGTIYALLTNVDGANNPTLATIVPGTGIATKIALLGDNFGGITFNAAGELFGVTNDGAGNGEVYWNIDKTTGEESPICSLGQGNNGDGLAYNSDDGATYHGSGDILQKINGIGSFTSPSGLTLFSIPREVPLLFEIDPFTAQTLGAVPIVSDFPAIGGTGLADNPSNTLYAVLSEEEDTGGDDERRLAKIDPITGMATDIGNLNEEIVGIAFKDGTLFGVTGQNSQGPGGNNLVTIDTSDATVTTLCELQDNNNPSSIAFNPTDGFLYYGFDGDLFRILDTDTCDLEDPIPLGPLLIFGLGTHMIPSIIPQAEAGSSDCRTRALTWSPLQDQFLCASDELYTVDTTTPGQPHDEIGDLDHKSKGLAFTFVSGAAIGGTSIPIDTTSLIVAGAQMTTAWLIPVLVAGAGFVLVIVRRK